MLRSIVVYLLLFWFTHPTVLLAQNDAASTKQTDKAPPDAKATDEPAKDSVPAPAGLSLEAVNKRIEELKAGQDPNKDKLLPLLQDTAKFLTDAEDYRREATEKTFKPEEVADEETKIREELEKNANREVRVNEINSREDVDALRQELIEAQQAAAKASKDLAALQLLVQNRDERLKAIADDRDAVDKRLEELKKLMPEGDTPEVLAASRDALQAEQQALIQKKNKLELEKPFYAAHSELRTLQQKQFQQQKTINENLAAALEKRLRGLGILQAIDDLDAAKMEWQAAPPELKKLARDNVILANKRVPPKSRLSLAETQTEASGTESEERQEAAVQRTAPLIETQRIAEFKSDTETFYNELKNQRDLVERYLKNPIRIETLGSILDEQRAKLESVGKYEKRISQHVREVADVRAELVDVESEHDDLIDPEDDIAETLAALPKERQDALKDETRRLLDNREALLGKLRDEYESLKSTFDELIQAESRVITFTIEYKKFLDEKSMWVRVSEPFSIDSFGDAGRSLSLLVDESSWRELLHACVVDIVDQPAVSVVSVLLLLAFLVLHARVKRRLREATAEVSQGYLASFYHTWIAFLCTVILAFWIPLLVMYLGYRLTPTDVGANFTTSVGYGLMSAAFLIGVLRLLQLLLRAQGLGITHFRWQKDRVFRIRLHLSWYMLTVVPITFLIALIRNLGNHDVQDSLGRLCHVAGLLLTSVFLYRVMVPPKPKDERSGLKLLTWPQKLMVLFLVLTPLSFAVLSLAGYSYTAMVLSRRLGFTAGILLVLVIVNEMAYRWLYIARGRLALEQARQRQEARDAELAASAEKGETSEAPKAFDPKSAGIDLSSINTQTRQLLTTTFRLAVFVALWFTWRDVAPPVHILDYRLWETNQVVAVAQQIQGENASPSAAPGLVNRWITVGDLLVFVLVIAVTIIASKNLPGLLEITILQNLPLDTGIRYAAGMLARYMVTAIGLVIAASIIGIGMTQVSILLGGLAVGLGFGLQELFGNFVSGIILLFEQPIRIGDIVTVGDVTGTVTRIRIRATTITNWDRKEFIVPNKEFITSQFMNWTLSDAVNRIVITVGVAYGSDTERARELLLKVCRDHPLVLNEPAPWAIFDAFGDSALNLTLACYLPDLSNRLAVTHDLHTMIDREFKRAGLEIAFPQMDLHLRSIDQEMTPLPLKHTSPVETRVETEKYS